MRLLERQVMRYLLVGGAVGAAGAFAIWSASRWTSSDALVYVLVVAVVYVVGSLASFAGHAVYTFRTGIHLPALPRHLALCALSSMAVAGCAGLLRNLLLRVMPSSSLAGTVAYVAISLAAALLTFVISRHFVFTRHARRPD